MKRMFLFAAALLGCTTAFAQTMKVVEGPVTTLIPAATASDIQFAAGGSQFTVNGLTFPTSTVSEILFDRSEVKPATLSIDYRQDGASVSVSADVAPKLKITVRGAHVAVLADPSLTEEVTYVLSGASKAGSFWMDGEYKSTLVLNSLELTNPDSAAVCIENGKRINVVLAEGTLNFLTDAPGGPQKACFFINGHAEFTGAGNLYLAGRTKHAYASDEYTQLKAGLGQVVVSEAAGDGLHIEQYFQMDGGKISVIGTKGDCIDVSVTKDPLDEFNGQAFLNGGELELHVTANDVKGLKTDSALTFSGGTVYAEVSGLGTKGFSVGTDLLIQQPTATPTVLNMDVKGTTYMPGDPELESKCRGMKIKGNYTFDGGSISMNVTGKKAKGISCDGTYTYKSGTTNVLPE